MTTTFGTELDRSEEDTIDPIDKQPAPKVDHEDELSPFDLLKAESNREIEKVVTFQHPDRPAFFLRFNAVIDDREIKRYENHAKGGKKKNADPDVTKGNCVMLAEKCVGLFTKSKNGEKMIALLDEDEDAMLLNSDAFLELYADKQGALKGTVESAVKKFLGTAVITKMSSALLREAGYEDDLTPVDPTID